MKILFVHNRYQQVGGEDAVCDAEMALISMNGHLASLALQDNSAINSLPTRVNAFLNITYSNKSRQWMREEISKHKPDVVHVHNFFPLLSPSIYDACIESGIPVVQTLHNYRTICPGALLMRDGKICEDCMNGSAYLSVRHRCYRGSAIGTFAVARMVQKHRTLGTWKSKVNRFIALTEFARSKFISAGFPEDKILVKPNFSVDSRAKENGVSQKRVGALFVGRLSQEKGVSTLMSAWRTLDIPLRVAGTGPLDHEVARLTGGMVIPLGMLDQKTVRKEMSRATFLVMPSECYEGFPMVLVEAFSQGLPVVASRLGAMAEIVEDGKTGLHFEAGNAKELTDKVQWMHEHPTECHQMGLNARMIYEEKYTPEMNYKILIDIYQRAIKDAHSHH